VFIDISVDQGGCSETTQLVTLNQPFFQHAGAADFFVNDMSGALQRDHALCQASSPRTTDETIQPWQSCSILSGEKSNWLHY